MSSARAWGRRMPGLPGPTPCPPVAPAARALPRRSAMPYRAPRPRSTTVGLIGPGQADPRDAGRSTIMLGATNEQIRDVNGRARRDLVDAGMISGRSVTLTDGSRAATGDTFVTRSNDRMLKAGMSGSEFVKNGDLWAVVRAGRDGKLDVRHLDHGGQTTLPADYVAEDVELGYASTVHRAQGMTVDSTHALITGSTSRELLYVAATRGSAENRLYVVTREPASLESVELSHGPPRWRSRRGCRPGPRASTTWAPPRRRPPDRPQRPRPRPAAAPARAAPTHRCGSGPARTVPR